MHAWAGTVKVWKHSDKTRFYAQIIRKAKRAPRLTPVSWCRRRFKPPKKEYLPSSWWKGSFKGFSSRDFRTPWVGGRKVGLIGRGRDIFSIAQLERTIFLKKLNEIKKYPIYKNKNFAKEYWNRILSPCAAPMSGGCSRASVRSAGWSAKAQLIRNSMCEDWRPWRQWTGQAAE